MKHLRSLLVAIGFACLGLVPVRAAKATSDILPPERRRAALEMAERLAQPAPLAAVPSDLPAPFNPKGFDQPDAVPARDAHGENRPGGDSKSSAPVPQNDEELLAAIAAKIPTTGTISVGGKPLLISGRNRIEEGAHFTVVYNGQEYELELTAIDRTTFTIRYKGQEFTRPIKLAKSP